MLNGEVGTSSAGRREILEGLKDVYFWNWNILATQWRWENRLRGGRCW